MSNKAVIVIAAAAAFLSGAAHAACTLETMTGAYNCQGAGCTPGAQDSSLSENDKGKFTWMDGEGRQAPITQQNDTVTVWWPTGQMDGDIQADCQRIRWRYDGHIDTRK